MMTLILALVMQVAPAVGNDEPKKESPKAAQQPENAAALSAAEWKELRESNIFAPPKPKKPEPKPREKDKPKEVTPPAPPPPKKLIVTGFFHDDPDKCFKVVIEDRTFKAGTDGKEGKYTFVGMKMLKAGDDVAGGKVGEVRIDSFDHTVGEAKKTYKAGEELTVPGETSSGATGPSSTETKPPDPKSVEDKLKELRERNKGKKPMDEDSGDEEPSGRRRRGGK